MVWRWAGDRIAGGHRDDKKYCHGVDGFRRLYARTIDRRQFPLAALGGQSIHLHPVWRICRSCRVALAGAAGTVFAVPIAAVLGVLVRRLFAFYRDSQFYKDEARGSIAKKSEARQVDAS